MTEQGSDMSGQTSIQRRSEYPHVYYLTMAYEAVNTRHAIINAIEQDYPGEKTIVLIHQSPTVKLSSSLINVVNLYATGIWPALWLAKVEAFATIKNDEGIAVWWDEDDMFEVDYTSKALEPMMADDTVVGTWTDKTYYVKKGEIVPGTYPRSNGTLALKVEKLKILAPLIRKLYKDGHRKKQGMTLTCDPSLIRMLGKWYNDRMRDHTGMRFYFMRSGGNGGPRRAGTGVNVDE